MKLKNLSVFLLLLISLTFALELQNAKKPSRSCCSGSCLRRCVKTTKSLSKCLKPCRGKLSRRKTRRIRRKLRARRRTGLRHRRAVRRLRGRRLRRYSRFRGRGRRLIRYLRRPVRRHVRRRNTRRRRTTTRKQPRRRRHTRRRRTNKKKVAKKVLVRPVTNKNLVKTYYPIKKFTSKRKHYLVTYYWPHWHNYYTTLSYYPYYHFYWFFYNHYHAHFPHYYHYYFHNHATIPHFHWPVSNIIYFHHHHPIVLHKVHVKQVSAQRHTLVRCEKGPRHLFTLNHKGKHFRIFLGDVNDFTNLGCLYFMDAVISVGKTSVVTRVHKLYNTKTKTLKVKGKTIKITPFKKSPFAPSNAKTKKVNNNATLLRFRLNRQKGLKYKINKTLLFWHLFNKQVKSGKDGVRIFNGIAKLSKRTTHNVLFIADHLEPKSLYVLKYLLTHFKKLSLKTLVRITYRRIRIFSGLFVHGHTHRVVVHSHHHHH